VSLFQNRLFCHGLLQFFGQGLQNCEFRGTAAALYQGRAYVQKAWFAQRGVNL
jgi:hypothetical protein